MTPHMTFGTISPERRSEAAASDLGENDDPEGPSELALAYAANRELFQNGAMKFVHCFRNASTAGRSLSCHQNPPRKISKQALR